MTTENTQLTLTEARRISRHKILSFLSYYPEAKSDEVLFQEHFGEPEAYRDSFNKQRSLDWRSEYIRFQASLEKYLNNTLLIGWIVLLWFLFANLIYGERLSAELHANLNPPLEIAVTRSQVGYGIGYFMGFAFITYVLSVVRRKYFNEKYNNLTSAEVRKKTRVTTKTREFAIAFKPGQFGYIWWWLLYVSTINAFWNLAASADAKPLTGGIIEALTTKLIPAMMINLLVVLVAYIAENLIGEMISTKGQFKIARHRVDSLGTLSVNLEKSLTRTLNTSMSEFDTMGTQLRALGAQFNVFQTTQALDTILYPSQSRLRDRITDRHSGGEDVFSILESKAKDKFADGYKEHTQNLVSQIKKLSKHREPLDLALLLLVLESNLEHQVRLLNTERRRFFGDWTTLARLAATIIEHTVAAKDEDINNEDCIEIFTMLRMKPSEFITTLGKADLSPDVVSESTFLKTSRLAAANNVPVRRHFFCLADDVRDEAIKRDIDSATLVHQSTIRKQFTDTLVKVRESDGEDAFRPDFEGVNDLTVLVADKSEERARKDKWVSIGKCINEYYHSGCAGYIELLNAEELDKFYEGSKEIDYFAVRAKKGKTSEWRFCLKSVVHEKANTHHNGILEIDLFYGFEQLSNSGSVDPKEAAYVKKLRTVKTELDVIFIPEQGGGRVNNHELSSFVD